MFSHFFIRRPIFATVISIVIVVGGIVALGVLPVARYPEIAPPTVQISAVYPGADAKTVSDTVATPIEQEVNGVENMIYMTSVCANDGTMNLTVTFEPGTDLDTANVLTQNRVSVAESRLPEEVKRQGVTVKKRSTDTVMYIAFNSPDGSYNDQALSNFVWKNIRDELARVPGVGDVQVFGVGQFSMRIWLNPEKLGAYNLAASDVINTIRQQNMQVAGGKIGGPPAPAGTAFEYTVNVKGRLANEAEFGNVVVKTDTDGSVLRVRDVARVELGSDLYNFSCQYGGKPAAAVAIYQIPGSNIIDVASGIREKMEDLSIPKGIDYTVSYDNTDIIKASIKNVITTLVSALILVVLTVYIFLQNFRATIIPAITIPVALIGTFAVLLLLGFSLNQLTLFGLVLVIGIVVDDAIVVVENTTRWIEEGLSPRKAAEKAMVEVAGPVIATTLVLLAVFVPTIFMGGITGTLFTQFAVTISVATVFSSINALTLSPALSALILRKQTKEPRGFFRLFNTTLDKTTNGYLGVTKLAIRRCIIAVLLFGGLTFAAITGLGNLSTGFVPQEDEGYCMINVQLLDGASLQRTQEVLEKINGMIKEIPEVDGYLTVAGYSLIDGAAATNSGMVVVTFKPWDERKKPGQHQSAIIAKLNQQLVKGVGGAGTTAFAFPMPSLPGVGSSGGFTFMLQDKSGAGLEALQASAQDVITDGMSQSGLTNMRTTFRSSVPQLFVDIDRDQVSRTGTSVQAVFDTLQVYLGSAYVNDFTYLNRIYKVTAQADAEFRSNPESIKQLKVRGPDGSMIPLGSLANIDDAYGPQSITRFQQYPSAKIQGEAAQGYSSGQALEIMEDLAEKKNLSFAWSELSFQEKQASGGGTTLIFLFAILMVYLVLAAQYESWSIPISVVLAVPTALLGAVIAVSVRGMDNNVYTQIGIVLLIGLSTKSAILIVEFAKVQREEGNSVMDAAVNATRLRFRAVLMTAFSFILGVIPLLVSSGAGAESQKVIGTSVFGGMIVATLVSLAAVPMLYYVVQRTADRSWGKGDKPFVPKKEDEGEESPS